jgi:regulatory protein YycI of two-component signal transduction system YycFG
LKKKNRKATEAAFGYQCQYNSTTHEMLKSAWKIVDSFLQLDRENFTPREVSKKISNSHEFMDKWLKKKGGKCCKFYDYIHRFSM